MEMTIPTDRQLSAFFARPIPKYFGSDEVAAILSDDLRKRHYKAWYLCLFLWNTGVRISEALSVKVKDIDLRGRSMLVKTKKRKNHTRVIPLKPEFVGETALWINQNGLKRENFIFHFTSRTALNYVRIACRMAGITDDRCHPHTFRHSFAVNCIIQGVPITVLQQWLGHRDITKTLIYTKILAHDSKTFMDQVKF